MISLDKSSRPEVSLKTELFLKTLKVEGTFTDAFLRTSQILGTGIEKNTSGQMLMARRSFAILPYFTSVPSTETDSSKDNRETRKGFKSYLLEKTDFSITVGFLSIIPVKNVLASSHCS